MNWWIVKQLRAMVLLDLREFVPTNYFDGDMGSSDLHSSLAGAKHFSRELAWGYRAGELGRKLFFESTVCMTPRQVAACEVLMNLGMLTSAEAAHGAAKELVEKARQQGFSDGNAGMVVAQLENQHIPAGNNNVRGALRQYFCYLKPDEKEPFLSLIEGVSYDLSGLLGIDLLVRILGNFNVGARMLADRRHGRPKFVIENEYDVHDLLFVGIRGAFGDARVEEWTPKHAGKSKRIDIVVPSLGALIEVKYVRSRDHARTIGDEIKIDVESYHAHPACQIVLIFVYDPNAQLPDPKILEADLSGRRVKGDSNFDVRLMVYG